jgi:hypothetical protein
MQYIFMASPSYSGSTLLSMVIGSHPDISTVGELKGISHRGDHKTFQCSSGELMIDSPFWLDMERRMQRRGCDFSLKNFNTRVLYPEDSLRDRLFNSLYFSVLSHQPYDSFKDIVLSRLLSKRYNHVVNAVHNSFCFAQELCSKEGAESFLDSSKDPESLKYLQKHKPSGTKLKLIHLIRNGKAVSYSFMRKGKISSIEAGARYWKQSHQKIERIKKHYFAAEDCLHLRYDLFCEKPEIQLRKISNFLNIENKFTISGLDNTAFHMIGNSMRLRPFGTIRYDNQWQDKLSKVDVEKFQQIAGGINDKYGFA